MGYVKRPQNTYCEAIFNGKLIGEVINFGILQDFVGVFGKNSHDFNWKIQQKELFFK